MNENLERLQQQLPLLDYLRKRPRSARPAGHPQEFVGLGPFHRETKPSFYVHAAKNRFYCHGCGRGGDLLGLVELSEHRSFRASLAYWQPPIALAAESEFVVRAWEE